MTSPNTGGNTPPPPNPNPNTPPPAPNLFENEHLDHFIAEAEASRTEAEESEHKTAVADRISNLSDDVDTYKSGFLGEVNAELADVQDMLDAEQKKDPADKNTELIKKLGAKKTKLDNDINRFNSRTDDEHEMNYLNKVLDDAREKYAKELAARTGQNVTLRHGRKRQVSRAQREYEIAHDVLFAVGEVTPPNPNDLDELLAAKERKLEFMLGALGDDPETSNGESFKLNREQVKQEKIHSGRWVEEEGTGILVEKLPNGKIATARRFVEDIYARWTAEHRDAKHWYSPKALWARAKKTGMLALAGGAVGAATGGVGLLFGTSAAIIGGAAATVGSARVAKAGAGVHLNKTTSQTLADERGEARAKRLEDARSLYSQALVHGYNSGFNEGQDLDIGKVAHHVTTEVFTGAANKANRKNRLGATVTGVGALLGIAGGADLLHDTFSGDTASEAVDNTRESSGTGTGSSSSSQTTTSRPSTTSSSPSTTNTTMRTSTPSTTTSAPSTPSSAPTSSSFRPEQSTSSQPTTSTSTAESKPPVNSQGREEKDIDKGKSTKTPATKAEAEADAKAKQVPPATEKAPDSKIIKMDVIKKGDWVSNFYVDQLGNGGYAEMLSNAKEAIAAGEIEKYDINTGQVVPDSDPTGNFYYRLTERGALRHGAPVGSSSTGDVLRVLADHSTRFTLAG